MRRSTKKTAAKRKATRKAYTYLREIEIRYRKRRVSGKTPTAKPIRGAQQVVDLFHDLQDETKEKLITISLDAKLKIICFEVVAIGSVASVYVRPFEAIRASLPLNPYGIILVHNHPGGDPRPSREDKTLTRELKKLTDAGGLTVHDHIIIGADGYFSFAEHDLL